MEKTLLRMEGSLKVICKIYSDMPKAKSVESKNVASGLLKTQALDIYYFSRGIDTDLITPKRQSSTGMPVGE
ncbi:MAG: hypothetical protein ABIH00_00260 [Armatimonadota bacterium]